MKKYFALALLSLTLPFVTLAAPVGPPDSYGVPDTFTAPIAILDFLDDIATWIFSILMVVAVIFILLAAYQYLTSGGGEGVQKAHKKLIYAAVAIAVGVASKGIVNVIEYITRP